MEIKKLFEVTFREKLTYLFCKMTERELAEKIGLDQWKLLVKLKDKSFTNDEEQKIEAIYNDLMTKE